MFSIWNMFKYSFSLLLEGYSTKRTSTLLEKLKISKLYSFCLKPWKGDQWLSRKRLWIWWLHYAIYLNNELQNASCVDKIILI